MAWGNIKRDRADIIFSKYVRKRANWTCESCGKFLGEGGGEASHFWGRRNEGVRYDRENVSCLCHFCHRHFTENPHEHTEWMKRKLGEKRFKALDVKAHSYFKKDRKMALLVAKELLKTLE